MKKVKVQCFKLSLQKAFTNHFDGGRAEIQIRHRSVVSLQHIHAFPGQGLDDRLVTLERGGLLGMKDEPTHMAVELPRQQQADDSGLNVFLLILISVEGVSQVGWDVICKKKNLLFID